MRFHGVDWYHLLPAHVKGILATLEKAGHEAYLVGGCVRDLWLGTTPKDFDLVSSATPDEVEALFPRTEGVGRAFGIMIVVTDSGPVEVARFRADADYKDGRHPTSVTFSSPEEDAKRRDFTMNALFYSPSKKQVIDYVDGLDDLRDRVIRCVGDPARRFEEDSLRILRAVRFHAQLSEQGFSLDPSMNSELRARASRLALVSKERITQEVEKIFLSPRPSVALLDLTLLELWKAVFGTPAPNLSILTNFDVLGEAFFYLARKKAEASLFHVAAARWLRHSSLPVQFVLTRESKVALEKVPPLFEKFSHYSSLSRAEKKLLLADPHAAESAAILRVEGKEEQLDLLDEAWENRENWEKSGTLNPPPLVTGNDLIALGMPPGPQIRVLLDEIRKAQLNEELTSKEEALARLKSQKK